VVPVGGDQNPHKIPIISTIWLWAILNIGWHDVFSINVNEYPIDHLNSSKKKLMEVTPLRLAPPASAPCPWRRAVPKPTLPRWGVRTFDACRCGAVLVSWSLSSISVVSRQVVFAAIFNSFEDLDVSWPQT
jgi:hypothetical protein